MSACHPKELIPQSSVERRSDNRAVTLGLKCTLPDVYLLKFTDVSSLREGLKVLSYMLQADSRQQRATRLRNLPTSVSTARRIDLQP